MIIDVPYNFDKRIPIVSDDIKERVRNGENISIRIINVGNGFVKNALKWGVAGLWIDGGRVGTEDDLTVRSKSPDKPNTFNYSASNRTPIEQPLGRFPANFITDGSDEVLELFPQSNGGAFPVKSNVPTGEHYEGGWGCVDNGIRTEMGNGSAARFFYTAKASRSERNAGLEGMSEAEATEMTGRKDGSAGLLRVRDDGSIGENPYAGKSAKATNFHPTVKPLALMRYLVKLTKTPTGGVVLDPFMGSGTTGCACALEGRDFIGIEREAEYMEIAEKRIANAQKQPQLELVA